MYDALSISKKQRTEALGSTDTHVKAGKLRRERIDRSAAQRTDLEVLNTNLPLPCHSYVGVQLRATCASEMLGCRLFEL